MSLFQRLFGSRRVKPRAIARKIGKIMDNSRTESVFKIYVPSCFRILLAAEDLEELEPYHSSVLKELIDYIHDHADREGYHLLSPPEILFVLQPDLRRGNFLVEVIDSTTEETQNDNTMIFGNSESSEEQDANTTLIFKSKHKEAPVLKVLQGNEPGEEFALQGNKVTLGRREDNRIVIRDSNVSRYHARIYQERDWYIEDLNSTNGVFVNKKKVDKSKLKSGDEIRLGSTLLKFCLK